MVLYDLFPDYDRSDCKTGNVLLSGISYMGAEDCFEHLLKEVMEEGIPVFLCNDHISSKKLNEIKSRTLEKGYKLYRLGTHHSDCPSFNVLSITDNPKQRAELLYSFLFREGDRTDVIYRYLLDCILYLQKKSSNYTVENILNLRIEEVRDSVRSFMSGDEAENEILFLETEDVYRSWGVLNDRADNLRRCGILDIISGDLDINIFFEGKILLMVGAAIDSIESGNTYFGLVNGFLALMSLIGEKRNFINKGYHIFINGSTKIRRGIFEAVLNVGKESPLGKIPVCVYEQSVINMLNVHGDPIIDNFSGIGVFNTNDGRFWSDFFGTTLLPEITETYTRRRTPMLVNIGGVVARRNSRYEGSAIHRVEKPLYEPRVFSSLRRKNLIFYNKLTNRKLRKQLKW